jgi:hypothetical protein
MSALPMSSVCQAERVCGPDTAGAFKLVDKSDYVTNWLLSISTDLPIRYNLYVLVDGQTRLWLPYQCLTSVMLNGSMSQTQSVYFPQVANPDYVCPIDACLC